jgi:hypothetical protein
MFGNLKLDAEGFMTDKSQSEYPTSVIVYL